MGWQDISRWSLKAAKQLSQERQEDNARSIISRAYYAAYSAIAAGLPKGTSFPRGRNNPSHGEIPDLIRNMGSVTMIERRRLAREFRFLYKQRVFADYFPHLTVDRSLALQCLHRASYICSQMGVLRK